MYYFWGPHSKDYHLLVYVGVPLFREQLCKEFFRVVVVAWDTQNVGKYVEIRVDSDDGWTKIFM